MKKHKEDNQEQKLQRAFSAVTSKLEIVLNRDNLIIVDCSAFPRFSSMLRNFDEGLCEEFDEGFSEWWKDNVASNVVYCKETNKELLDYIDTLRMRAGSLEKEARNAYGFARIDIINKARGINKTAKTVLELLEKFIHPSRVEDYISESFGADLEKPRLKNIYDAAKEISKIPGVITNLAPKYRTKKFYGNSENDPKILAKTLAISYEQPVSLVTRDADFHRMLSALAKNIAYYSKRYDFDIPFGEVEVFKLHRKGLTRHYISRKREELSNLVECELEDITPKNILG